MNIAISVEHQPDGYYKAIDTLTYDVDYDDGQYVECCPTGTGRTPWEAIRELIDNMEEEAGAD